MYTREVKIPMCDVCAKIVNPKLPFGENEPDEDYGDFFMRNEDKTLCSNERCTNKAIYTYRPQPTL
jgi:NAD-dependent SIR2 family protein deacetylase